MNVSPSDAYRRFVADPDRWLAALTDAERARWEELCRHNDLRAFVAKRCVGLVPQLRPHIEAAAYAELLFAGCVLPPAPTAAPAGLVGTPP